MVDLFWSLTQNFWNTHPFCEYQNVTRLNLVTKHLDAPGRPTSTGRILVQPDVIPQEITNLSIATKLGLKNSNCKAHNAHCKSAVIKKNASASEVYKATSKYLRYFVRSLRMGLVERIDISQLPETNRSLRKYNTWSSFHARLPFCTTKYNAIFRPNPTIVTLLWQQGQNLQPGSAWRGPLGRCNFPQAHMPAFDET